MSAVRRSPDAEGVGVGAAHFLSFSFDPNLEAIGPVDGSLGNVVDRARLIRGRHPDPRSSVDVAIDESITTRDDLGLGDHVDTISVRRILGSSAQSGMTDLTLRTLAGRARST